LIGIAEGVAMIASSVGPSETPFIHIARPPFWIGYASLVGAGPRRFTTTMRTSGWMLRIPGPFLIGLLDKETDGWKSLLRLSMKYGDIAATIAGDLVMRGSERRVIATLLRCSGHRDPSEGPQLKCVPITQGELADATNLSRNSVITILQGLAARNVIELGRGNIVIHDAAALMQRMSADCAHADATAARSC